MARKLEDLLGPWERVVFRSASGRRRVTILSVILSLIILLSLAPFLAIALSNPVNSPAGISSLVLTLVAGYAAFLYAGFIVKIWRRMVLVTDRRVLYRRGTWRSKITEIPLVEITGVRLDTLLGKFSFQARIERSQRGGTIISLVPRLAELCDAIAAQTGIPAPQRYEKAARRGVISLAVGASLGGVALSSIPIWLGTNFWDDVFLFPTNSPYSGIAAGIVGFIGFVGYLWLIAVCFFAGFMLGFFPAIAILRFFLTLDQARQVVCMGYASIPTNRIGKVWRWNARQMARFASWLYGQEIRCD